METSSWSGCQLMYSDSSSLSPTLRLVWCFGFAAMTTLPLRKLNYVLFSSHWRNHWCVAFCAVNRLASWHSVIHHWTDHRQLIALASSRRHRSIAGIGGQSCWSQLTRSTVHSMRWSQILGQNPRFLATPRAFDAHVRWGFCQNIAIKFNTEKLEWCG